MDRPSTDDSDHPLSSAVADSNVRKTRSFEGIQDSQETDFLRILIRAFVRVIIALVVILALVGLCVAYAHYVEPTWICVKRIKLSPSPTVRVIHITDIHFKGDKQYLERVVHKINHIDADLVCFTGDMIEEAGFLKGALEILSKVNKPMYGVPGNHDEWALRSFDDFGRAFRGTGGDWLTDNPVLASSTRVVLVPSAAVNQKTPQGYKRILFEHYPEVVEQIHDEHFDLMLAGHTHGGQIGIPWMHWLFRDCDLGRYERGLYQTPCGPLYVNPGIGTYFIKARFLCRPEITLIEL